MNQRLCSLDALRGLDMLLILGVDVLVYRMYQYCPQNGVLQLLREQMGHAPWEGLRVYDCIFPLFVFLSGIAMALSMQRRRDAEASTAQQLLHLFRRAMLLVVLGWVVNGPLSWDLQRMRFASVLGLIGISGALAGCWVLAGTSWRWFSIAGSGLIILAVGGMQHYGGDFTPAGCFNAKVDALLCPGVLHSGSYDPEGPLCILSATALCLLGHSAGQLFLHTGTGKRLFLLAAGSILLPLSACFMPVIKGIWTPAFVLCTAGIGCGLMLAFHVVADLLRLQFWCKPLLVVGSNALFIYLIVHLVDMQALAARLSSGTWLLLLPNNGWQHIATSGTAILLAWLLCYVLYKRRIFIRI